MFAFLFDPVFFILLNLSIYINDLAFGKHPPGVPGTEVFPTYRKNFVTELVYSDKDDEGEYKGLFKYYDMFSWWGLTEFTFDHYMLWFLAPIPLIGLLSFDKEVDQDWYDWFPTNKNVDWFWQGSQ